MTDVILQWQLTLASIPFPYAFKTVTLLFHITQFFSIGYIGKACWYSSFLASSEGFLIDKASIAQFNCSAERDQFLGSIIPSGIEYHKNLSRV